ncbi:M23 family metallopeptidase [uncultured Duncaniella sp.]|uniref:M23 family metallopeptidase n=1 Tax=uncultured Duncaniella sp. TaxID=2768039 RepID=UPI0025FDABF6|nr:M23 family metallopeptidase [uncultured Duncaniella sp.]
MKFLKLKTLLATLLISTAAFSADAQLKLPASHTNQHNSLIANQKPSINPFKIENNDLLLNQIKEREAAMNNEIYASFWNSDRVNPYGTAVTIPEHKDIDVSEYTTPTPGHITSNYGYRSRFGRMHYGIDLKLQVGDTVRAAFSGKVRLTKYERRGYGYYVVVRHDNGLETVYGHLSRFLVKPDQYVKAGEPIALGGNTGRSTGAHLHFETRYLGIPINPAAIIDFENGVPHKDVFAFDKRTYGKSQKYTPARRSTKKYASRKRKSTRRTTTTTAKK